MYDILDMLQEAATRRQQYLASRRSNCNVDRYNRAKSNFNMLIESPYSTTYFDGNSNVGPICHHFNLNVGDLDLDRIGQGQK